jgi:competence protein ComEC
MAFNYGDFIRFHSRINSITTFQNPGGFDYKRYLNRQGIFVSGSVANRSDIILLRRNSAGTLTFFIESFRDRLRQIITQHAGSPSREILTAMTLGDSGQVPIETRDIFAKTGTSHILAISGLHIGIVASAGFFLIFWLMKSSEYLMLRFNLFIAASLGAFVLVVFYAFIAGMGTTVLRATIMAGAVLAALLVGRQRDLYNTLFLAALIVLMISPESLFHISFQLSFSAVFGILYIVPKFSEIPLPSPLSATHFLQTAARRFFIFILVSSAATISTLPIIAFYFNRVSFITLIANCIAVPVLGFLTLALVMLFIFSSLFSTSLAGCFVKFAGVAADAAVGALSGLARLEWSSMAVVRPSILEIILYYILIYLIVQAISPDTKNNLRRLWTHHRGLLKIMLVLILMFLTIDVAYYHLKDRFSRDMNITAIDVGQGSSTLVQFPRGITMLIDGGGFHDSSFDMGMSVIAPFLYAKRIRKIDIVVLTHPHPDHLQGLIHIVKNFHVREVWSTGLKADHDLYRFWEKALSESRIPVKHFSSLSPAETVSGAQIEFIWPHPPEYPTDRYGSNDETNDASLVFKITYRQNSFLFTGDISDQVEALLIADNRNLKSDILFVPHHGSVHSSSSDFIRAVSCRWAIVSAGRKNIFRHPHPLVLSRYASLGVDIYRTDQHGAIFIATDGRNVTIKPRVQSP